METTIATSAAKPRQLLNLAGCFDYPTPNLAQRLKVRLEDLESNHIRLFINDRDGVKAPPYAGCYLNQSDRRQFMIDFSGLCRQQGIVLGPSHPPDHIPAMLEALALLLTEAENTKQIDIRPLLESYYRQWPERFAAAVEQYDETGFYTAMATELKETLAALDNRQANRLKTH